MRTRSASRPARKRDFTPHRVEPRLAARVASAPLFAEDLLERPKVERSIMPWGKAREFLSSICSREPDAGVTLSRRNVLAGLGLTGLFVATPTLLISSPAEAAVANTPPVLPERSADVAEAEESNATDAADVTDVSAQRWRRRYWRRRYWRRRYWRRVYWRRRYWRGPYWRRRYWRRRYWRRRYRRPYW